MKKLLNVMLALVVVMTSVLMKPISVSAAGNTYYVDPKGNDNNNGTSISTPWSTLEKVNATTFQPGDKILFKADGSWTGTLHPLGSGDSSSQITIDMYGTGSKPLIAGNGAFAAVELDGQQYWTIQNLQVTNMASDRTLRQGIYVNAMAEGITNNIFIYNNEVYNVSGENRRSVSNSLSMYWNSGIYVTFPGKCSSSNHLNNVDIEGNYVHDVLTSGIRINQYDDYVAYNNFHTNVHIKNNTISKTGSDGMIVANCSAPLIENNLVYDSGYNGNSSETQIIAGMWPCGTSNAIFQYNEVARTAAFQSDGTAFDTDWGTGGTTIFQYNYTHGNGGGFWLDCAGLNYDTSFQKTICRYNVSVDDQNYLTRNGQTNCELYNNVFYKSSGALDADFNSDGSKHKFWNNIFNFQTNPTSNWQSSIYVNNLYYPCSQNLNDKAAKTGNPLFINPGAIGDGMSYADNYKVQSSSPCINTGITIPGAGSYDFWGNALYSGLPDIGAMEYPGGTGGGYSTLVSGAQYKIVGLCSGKVLTVSGASTNNGAAIVQYGDYGGSEQRWTLTAKGSNYTLTNVNSGKMLGISGGSTSDGTPAIQLTSGAADQIWQLQPQGGGAYKLINKNSGKALGIGASDLADGTGAIQWTSGPTVDQVFVFIPVSSNIDVYNFASDFSTTQGYRNWYYMQFDGSTYSNMSWSSSQLRWAGSYTYNLIWSPAKIHPDTNDSVIAWKAPKAGTVTISGNPRKGNSGGDGVNVKIVKNTSQLWPSSGWQFIGGTDFQGVTHNITSVSVAENDMIYFILDQNSNSSCDETVWNPTITYQ